MKRSIAILAVILIFVLSLGTMAAENVFGTVTNLINAAVNNSRQATLDQMTIEMNEVKLEEAKNGAENPNIAATDRVTRLERNLKQQVEPMKAELELELSKRRERDNKYQLKASLFEKSMDYLLTQKEIQKDSKLLEIKNYQYELANGKLKNKTMTQVDVDTAKYNKEEARLNLVNAENNLKDLQYQINLLAENNIDAGISITDPLTLMPALKVDLNDILSKINKMTDIYKAEKQYEINSKIFELTAAEYVNTDKEYQEARNDMEKAKLDLESIKEDMEVSIRRQKNALDNGLKKVDLAKEYMELMQEKLTIGKKKLDLGLLSKEELYAIEEESAVAEYGYYAAIRDYNVAYDTFNNTVINVIANS